MICTTIQNKILEQIVSLLDKGTEDGTPIEMAEIRLDKCDLDDTDIQTVFSTTDVPLVATCRIAEVLKGVAGDKKRAYEIVEKRLRLAIEAGAAYCDLEIEAPSSMGKRIRKACTDCGTMLIRSYHDFEGTADVASLKETISRCREFGADVVKLVTTARSEEDASRVMSLYEGEENLIAFCMDEAGKGTRLECLRLGAPYTYAALNAEEAAAPGQWPVAEMMKAVYGDRKTVGSEDAIRIPASKSFAQRAIIAAALADGTSHLRGYAPCGDNESAIAVASSLGAKVSVDGDVVTIKGIAARTGMMAKNELHVGESGLLTRLMVPVISQISSVPTMITGEKTLVNRPLSGAVDIMASFGVMLANGQARDKSFKDVFVPVKVTGPIIPGRADVSGKNGSQLISGLMMALPLSAKNSTMFVHEPKSIPYMFITADVLKKFGVRIDSEMEGGEGFVETQDWSLCSDVNFRIKGNQKYKATDMDLEGDWSTAANFLVAGAVFGNALLSGLDSSSLQADLSIMDVLVQAGASLSQLDGTGEISVQRAPLTAFDFDANNCPDLFPILAVLACFCEGESHILGTGRLAGKESNRAKAIIEMLAQMDVEASIQGDELTVRGMSLARRLLSGKLLKGGSYTSNHDHRMVMALRVAELGADGPIEIDDEKCVAKSCPTFHELFAKMK